MKKIWIYLIALLFLGALAFIPKVRELFLPVAEIKQAVQIDDASYDIQLKGLNTPDINLKSLKGDKLVFLNFWGTWCAPCREEWPTIEALYQSRNKDIDFVLIAMLDKEEDVLKFLKENKYTAPVYIAESPINEQLLPKVYPTTFLLDSRGQILKKETATLDWNSKEVHEFIDNILK